MARKTVDISYLTKMANMMLAQSHTNETGFRQGVINMIEAALVESDQYKGFRYLAAAELPAGSKPGINLPAENYSLEERFKNTDPTRRCYS